MEKRSTHPRRKRWMGVLGATCLLQAALVSSTVAQESGGDGFSFGPMTCKPSGTAGTMVCGSADPAPSDSSANKSDSSSTGAVRSDEKRKAKLRKFSEAKARRVAADSAKKTEAAQAKTVKAKADSAAARPDSGKTEAADKPKKK